MTYNLLKALYLDWFENGLLRNSFFEVRHVPFPNFKQVAHPRFYRHPGYPKQWHNHHLFFGVNPRSRDRDSKSVSHIVALYADIDQYDEETLLKLQQFEPRISAILCSGRGLHTYWFLKSPIPFSEANHVPNILRGISKQLNSDPAAVSIAQLLRIPGSRNPKNNAVCKEIFIDSERRYDICEFSRLQEGSKSTSSQLLASQQGSPIMVASCLPARFIQDLQNNPLLKHIWSSDLLTEFRSGSERDFALCMKLAWRKYLPDEIATILFLAPYPKKHLRNLHYISKTVWRATTIVEEAKLNRIA
jgi:hypothetical protein